MATVQAEERIVAERAERTRLEAAAEQRTRTIDLFQRNKQTIEAMMIQFDTLISEGVYNVLYTGGMGNIVTTSAPFGEAQAAGPAGLRPAARRAAPLQRQRPRARRRRLRLLRHGLLHPGNPVPRSDQVSLPAHHAGRHPRVGPVPRHPDDRVPRRRLVAVHLREADQEVRQGRRPLRPRRQDQADPREARRADLDVVQRGNAARRRPQVHQAGDDDRHLPGHPDLRRSDRPPGGREDR